MGRDLAPRLAARLGVGLASDCIALEVDAEAVDPDREDRRHDRFDVVDPHRAAGDIAGIQLEEQAAHKKVLTLQRGGQEHRIGIIEIPTFYADFKAIQRGDPNYKSTTRDVRRLIEALQTEGDGIECRTHGELQIQFQRWHSDVRAIFAEMDKFRG